MANSNNTLKITAVAGDEAERDCDSCDDTVDDSGMKITATVDGRSSSWYLCEECLTDSLDISERVTA